VILLREEAQLQLFGLPSKNKGFSLLTCYSNFSLQRSNLQAEGLNLLKIFPRDFAKRQVRDFGDLTKIIPKSFKLTN